MDYQGFIAREPAGFFRGVARESLRGRGGTALWAGFIYTILLEIPILIFDSMFGQRVSFSELMGRYQSFDPSGINEIYGNDTFVTLPSGISGLYTFFTTAAFSLGIAIFVIHILRRSEAGIELIFAGFGNYFRSLGVMILIGLINLAVILVFGIIAVFMFMSGNYILMGLTGFLMLGMAVVLVIVNLIYGLSYYILADNPKIGIVECLRTSRLMMKGNKGSLFILHLTFIGWGLLYLVAAFTIGVIIGFLSFGVSELIANIIASAVAALGAGILIVYFMTAEAAFYERVSGISSGMFNLSGANEYNGNNDNNILNKNPGQIPDGNQDSDRNENR